jgi:hypothetical protein
MDRTEIQICKTTIMKYMGPYFKIKILKLNRSGFIKYGTLIYLYHVIVIVNGPYENCNDGTLQYCNRGMAVSRCKQRL